MKAQNVLDIVGSVLFMAGLIGFLGFLWTTPGLDITDQLVAKISGDPYVYAGYENRYPVTALIVGCLFAFPAGLFMMWGSRAELPPNWLRKFLLNLLVVVGGNLVALGSVVLMLYFRFQSTLSPLVVACMLGITVAIAGLRMAALTSGQARSN